MVTWDLEVFLRQPIEVAAGEISVAGCRLSFDRLSDGWVICRADREASPRPIAKLTDAGEVAREDSPPAVAVLMSGARWWRHALIGPADVSDDDLEVLEKWLCAAADRVSGVVFDPSSGQVVWPPGAPRVETTRGVLVDVMNVSLFAPRPANVRGWVNDLFEVVSGTLPEALPARGGGSSSQTARSIADVAEAKIANWRAEPPCYRGMLHASGPIAFADFTIAAGAMDDPQRRDQVMSLVAAFGAMPGSLYACGVRCGNLRYRDGKLYSAAGTTGVLFYREVIGSRWPGLPRRGPLVFEWFGAAYVPHVPLVVDQGHRAGAGVFIEYGASDAPRAHLVPHRLLISDIPNRPAALIPEGL